MESRACLPHSKFKEANTCCEFMAVQWNPVFKRLESPLGCCTIRQVVRCQFWVVVGRLVQAIASWGELPLTSVELIFGSPIVAFSFFLSFFFFWPHREACRIPIPWPCTEPVPPAVEAWSLNQWTTREFPLLLHFKVAQDSFFFLLLPKHLLEFFFFFFRSSTGSL